MTDYLGMIDNTTPIINPPDVLVLAWQRYDEAATREDHAWYAYGRRPIEWTRNSKEALDLLRGAEDAELETIATRDDKNMLTKGNCTCEQNPLLCAYCAADKRVMNWHNQR